MFMRSDRWSSIGSVQKCMDGFAIRAHVRAVRIEEQARCSFALRYKTVPQFEFAILSMRATECPVHIDTVGDDRHSEDAVAQAPRSVVVFRNAADGVAARVRRIIPRAVVIDSPISE